MQQKLMDKIKKKNEQVQQYNMTHSNMNMNPFDTTERNNLTFSNNVLKTENLETVDNFPIRKFS